MTERRAYLSGLSDARWALIESTLTAWRQARIDRRPTAVPAPTDLREVFNAILYVSRTGIPWKYLPHDFPNSLTVPRGSWPGPTASVTPASPSSSAMERTDSCSANTANATLEGRLVGRGANAGIDGCVAASGVHRSSSAEHKAASRNGRFRRPPASPRPAPAGRRARRLAVHRDLRSDSGSDRPGWCRSRPPAQLQHLTSGVGGIGGLNFLGGPGTLQGLVVGGGSIIETTSTTMPYLSRCWARRTRVTWLKVNSLSTVRWPRP
jgi:hypothetical protein